MLYMMGLFCKGCMTVLQFGYFFFFFFSFVLLHSTPEYWLYGFYYWYMYSNAWGVLVLCVNSNLELREQLHCMWWMWLLAWNLTCPDSLVSSLCFVPSQKFSWASHFPPPPEQVFKALILLAISPVPRHADLDVPGAVLGITWLRVCTLLTLNSSWHHRVV